MKKLLAITFLATLAVSCSKKTSETKDSNVMLEEPKAQVTDSAAVAKPAENTAVTPSTDTATAKADSATAK